MAAAPFIMAAGTAFSVYQGLSAADAQKDAAAQAEEIGRQNAAIIEKILNGTGGPATGAVLINAGFVAVLAGQSADVRTGVTRAAEAIASGRTAELLRNFRKLSRTVGK